MGVWFFTHSVQVIWTQLAICWFLEQLSCLWCLKSWTGNLSYRHEAKEIVQQNTPNAVNMSKYSAVLMEKVFYMTMSYNGKCYEKCCSDSWIYWLKKRNIMDRLLEGRAAYSISVSNVMSFILCWMCVNCLLLYCPRVIYPWSTKGWIY